MPAPAFIYNAGQVYRLGGEKEKAVEHYKKYLELEPKGEGAEDARQFIAELTAAIEADRTAASSGTGEPDGTSAMSGGGGGGGGGGAPPVRDAAERPGRGLMLAGMVSGGIGVAAMGAAVVFALRARSAESDLDGYQGVWTPDQQDRYATGESAERNMTISVVIGWRRSAPAAPCISSGAARRSAPRPRGPRSALPPAATPRSSGSPAPSEEGRQPDSGSWNLETGTRNPTRRRTPQRPRCSPFPGSGLRVPASC